MKTLQDIKFGELVLKCIWVPYNKFLPVTYDKIVRSSGLTSKQVQKALVDLAKAGYIQKDAKGMFSVTEIGFDLMKEDDGQETTTGL